MALAAKHTQHHTDTPASSTSHILLVGDSCWAVPTTAVLCKALTLTL